MKVGDRVQVDHRSNVYCGKIGTIETIGLDHYTGKYNTIVKFDKGGYGQVDDMYLNPIDSNNTKIQLRTGDFVRISKMGSILDGDRGIIEGINKSGCRVKLQNGGIINIEHYFLSFIASADPTKTIEYINDSDTTTSSNKDEQLKTILLKTSKFIKVNQND